MQSSAFYDFGTFLQTFPIFIDFNRPKIYFSELKFSEIFWESICKELLGLYSRGDTAF